MKPVRYPHDPSRAAAPGRAARRFTAIVAVAGAVATAGSAGVSPVEAQSVQRTGIGSSGIGEIEAMTGPPVAASPLAPVTTVRFGLSGAVNVLIAAPGTRLDPVLLGVTGARWDLGHRWLGTEIVGSVPVPNGQIPVAVAAPTTSAGGTMASRSGGSSPAPSPGPRLIGVPVGQTTEEVAPPAPTLPGFGTPASPIIAPTDPGIWMLENPRGNAVTVVTLVSASRMRGGRLNGYEIGGYPTAGSGRTDSYAPPTGFIEVTPANRDLAVSRHLTIGQFLTKDQFDVWPKYVALDMRLIDKIELVIQELNAMGVRAGRVHVMSGFRTPRYNGPGGDGRAALSRHMWGDAADLWIDDDGDGMMDDLDGDGEVNFTDASLIMRAVDRVEAKYPALVGGAGLYAGSDIRGPYIHIDARGTHARW